MKKVGITPARLLGYNARWDYTNSTDDLPTPPKYTEFKLTHKRLVPPGTKWEPERADPAGLGIGVDIEKRMADSEWAGVVATRKFLMFWGKLTYLDVSGTIHETRFCFWYNSLRAEWWISGPEGYNENT
jgi:hypothetical protein